MHYSLLFLITLLTFLHRDRGPWVYMYALLGKYHELWTFIPVIVTTSPHSIIFHYHLIFFSLYFHHYLFHSSFSLLGVMILRIFWYIEDSHITPFFIPSFDIDLEILA